MMSSVKEPLAGLALLVILGFLIWYNRPLENARLFDPYLPDETARFTEPGAYEAWLWQDPFGFDPDHGSGGAARAWALAARGGKRDENFSSAVPDGLTCKVSLSSVLEPAKKDEEQPKEGEEVKPPIETKSVKEKRPIVLAPLVRVAPHTLENREMRTRQRYAVVAGLVESGYRPREPGMLHFCSIQENREKDGRENDDPEMDRREYDMRWERYQYKPNGESGDDSTGGKPDIVVAWIDSRILADESKLRAGFEGISENNQFYLFDVANILEENPIKGIKDQNDGSAGVVKGRKEGQDECSRAENIRVIKLAGMESKENGEASTATSVQTGEVPESENRTDKATGQAVPTQGKEDRRASKGPGGQSSSGAGQCEGNHASEEAGSDKSARKATVGTGQEENKKTGSEKLAELMATELMLRGVTHRSQVMTISEQGSENAATLGVNFRNCLSKLLAGQERATESPAQEVAQPECGKPTSAGSSGDASRRSDEIRNLFYLKGLDGKSPGIRDQYDKDKNDKDGKGKDGKGRNESGRANKGEKVPSIELRHSPPLPVGSSQLDYFYRLAEEMNNAHHVVDIDKRDSGIRAVVLLGSNFNDKLRIIQALREKMPHLLVLTTDLDAQMLHPKHWRATRNLVVASHFDLRLREKTEEDEKETDNRDFSESTYQDQFPPFRDSQQTNIFYRTRSIAEGGAKGIEKSAETFPRIFEVGRNGFVPLGTAEKTDVGSYYHPPDDTWKNTAKELWLLLPIAVSLILFHWAIRPWSGLFSRYLFFGTSILFALAFGFGTDVFSNNELKERFSFTTERAVLLVLIGVSLMRFLWPKRSLLFSIAPAIFVVALGFGSEVFSTNELKEPFSFTNGVSLWPALFIQILAILLAGMLIFQAMFELDMNSCRLGVRYFSNQSSSFSLCPNEFESWARRRRSRWRFFTTWLRRIKELNSRERLVLLSLIGSIVVYAFNDVYPSKFPFWWCFGLLLWIVAIVYMPDPWNDVSVDRKRGLFLLIGMVIIYVLIDVYPLEFPSGLDYFGFLFNHFPLLVHTIILEFPFWLYFGLLLWAAAIAYLLSSWSDVSKRKKSCFSFLIWTSIVYVLIDVYPLEFPFWLYFVLLLIGGALVVYLRRSWDDISIKHWVQDNGSHPSGQVNPENNLWGKYYDLGRSGARVARVMAMWLIFALIETLLVYLLPPWPLPWRGTPYSMPPWIGVLSFTVTMLLLFFVLDAVRLNFYWIRKLRTQHPWLRGSVPGRLDYSLVAQRLARLEDIVSLVAGRTQAVDRLIYYPMFCIMLMLLAKITYFDNQEFPLSKGITFAAAISFLFFSGFVLRHEADELRNCVKKSLQDLRVNNATQGIDETISRIDAIDEGAFQPMLEQPVMQALLIMLASVGLFAGEYLKVFG